MEKLLRRKRLLIICGPTSTGKTSLAIKLAKKFNAEIVSADSRQVYRGMDIGTGKDLPKNIKLEKTASLSVRNLNLGEVYNVNGVSIWGYDLADPKHEFSISQYLKIVRRIIEDIYKRKKLPILVGGSGLYIKGVVEGIPTAEVPKSTRLRKNLERRNASELYEILANLDSSKAASFNSSDRKNPRRLIRAIEVAQYLLDHGHPLRKIVKKDAQDYLFIGLTAPKEILVRRIGKRVETRVREGIIQEIKKLLKGGVNWEDQSMMSLGYAVWRDFFEGDVPESVIIDQWIRDETKYSKRQMTWFKKEPDIKWFDITKSEFEIAIEKVVEKWYKK